MWRSFRSWDEIASAGGRAGLERVIRPGGLARVKARRILAILREIKKKYGRYDLSVLKKMSRNDARSLLMSFSGVGPKTAACVLIFSCGMPAFPVDTHIHRVTSRLGLIPPRTTREKAHELLEMIVPEKMYFTFHINLIRHGRHICKAGSPYAHHAFFKECAPMGKKVLIASS
jgi:endonuclease-3